MVNNPRIWTLIHHNSFRCCSASLGKKESRHIFSGPSLHVMHYHALQYTNDSVSTMMCKLLINCSEKGFCNTETTDEGVRGIFHWNKTEVNSTTSTVCFYGPPDVIVTRFCVSRNNLTAPSVEICRTIASTRFDTLQNVRY